MEKGNKKKHPAMQKLGLSLLTVAIVGIIVFTTYYFTLNKEDSKYINKLYSFKIDVDKSNDAVVDAIKNIDIVDIKDTKSIDQIKSQVSASSETLKNVLQDIQKLNPPAKYKTQFENYVNGIYSNRKILIQTNLILKNTKSNDISNAIDALYRYVSDASKYYEESKLKKAYISLPTGIIGMPDKVKQYAVKSYNDYENRTRNLEVYQSYFKSMDDILTNFNNSKVDFSSYLDMIKNNQISFSDVYVKIEEKLSDLTSIESSYNSLSSPPKLGDRYNQFSDLLERYGNYCLGFKDALTKYEESQNNSSSPGDTSSNFSDLSAEYKSISQAFIDYLSQYNGDKTKYSNANNL